MKKIIKIMSFAVVIMSFIVPANAQNANVKQERDAVLAPFPQAESGMMRYVIWMDKKSDESLYQVEIIPGKVMSVDNNIHRLMGSIEEKTVGGWGYTYYVFTSNGQTASTLMASIGPNADKFISSQSRMVRYNSRMPIVVYAPLGYEMQYKIWKAGKSKPAPVL